MGAFRKDGPLWFCSNFAPCMMGVTIVDERTGEPVMLPTSEHAFVYFKLDAPHIRARVREVKTPGEAKRLGGPPARMVPGWEQPGGHGRVATMLAVLRAKFEQNPLMKRDLLMTGDQSLVETNEWHDNFWGSCTCARCGDRGENWLGKLLMSVRAEFRGAWTEAEAKRGYK